MCTLCALRPGSFVARDAAFRRFALSAPSLHAAAGISLSRGESRQPRGRAALFLGDM